MKKTVQDIINLITATVPGVPFPDTVDTLKTGSAAQGVDAIAVTFMATYEAIEQAIARGANLIVTHEPTFYGHTDETDWLITDPVYQAKRRLIDDHHVAIWRFHDYLHALQPDPTIVGLLKRLAWANYASLDRPLVCQLPPRSLQELADEIKSKLGLDSVRVVGELHMPCKTVGILVGASGGRSHITALNDWSLDVLVCGEINEWETNEYVRDALASGRSKALIVTGHSISEEDGMREIAAWLQEQLPEIPVMFIPTGNSLRAI